MTATDRRIYRARTMRHPVTVRAQAIPPSHTGTQLFMHLWLILVIFGALGLLALSIPLPL
jgi:hypothetical protein